MQQDVQTAQATPVTNFDISPLTLLRAAQERYGPDVELSTPYWVDSEVVRVGVALNNGNISFGANFPCRVGQFH